MRNYALALFAPLLISCLNNPDEDAQRCFALRAHVGGGENCQPTTTHGTVEFLINGVSNALQVSPGQSVTVTWAAEGPMEDCVLSPGNVSGLNRSIATEGVTETTTFTLNCEEEDGEVISTSILVVVAEQTPEEEGGPALVDFTIPEGTAQNAPWNSVDDPVVVKVGDTLRVHNDSSAAMRIHTNSRRPFNHAPANIPTGSFQDYLVTNPCNGDCGAYNHNSGPGAAFHILSSE